MTPSLTILPGDAPKEVTGTNVHFSSQSSEWATPDYVFDHLDNEFHFTLDPCSTHDNAKCAQHYTTAEDGLSKHWGRNVVFMNPPYGRAIRLWMAKAKDAADKGATVVCLVPARTDTNWWHTFAMQGEIRLIKGRLKFNNHKHSAPFPSAIVIFRPSAVTPGLPL